MTGEPGSAYRYGLIAAAMSGVISRYIDKEPIEPKDKQIVAKAENLLTDALNCRSLFEPRSKHIEASTESVQFLDSSVSAVVGCIDLSNVQDLEDLMDLLLCIRKVIRGLSGEDDKEALTQDNLNTAKLYFNCLAKHMVDQVSEAAVW